MNSKRVVVLVPNTGSMYSDTAQSIIEGCLQLTKDGHYVTTAFMPGAILSRQRNVLSKHTIETLQDMDYAIFVDSDMVFTNSCFSILINRDVDVVGAAYTNRHEPHRSTATLNDKSYLVDPIATGLTEVDCMGMGLVAIKTSVFRKLPFPWFDFTRAGWGGEDEFFYAKCKRHDIPVYCDNEVSKLTLHIGINPLPYDAPLHVRASMTPEQLESLEYK